MLDKWVVGCWPQTVGEPYSVIESILPSEGEAIEEMDRMQDKYPEIPWFYSELQEGDEIGKRGEH